MCATCVTCVTFVAVATLATSTLDVLGINDCFFLALYPCTHLTSFLCCPCGGSGSINRVRAVTTFRHCFGCGDSFSRFCCCLYFCGSSCSSSSRLGRIGRCQSSCCIRDSLVSTSITTSTPTPTTCWCCGCHCFRPTLLGLPGGLPGFMSHTVFGRLQQHVLTLLGLLVVSCIHFNRIRRCRLWCSRLLGWFE